MKPRIILEVSGGCVAGVYADKRLDLDVILVDLDGAEVGDATEAERLTIQPLTDASDIVIECVEPETIKQRRDACAKIMQELYDSTNH